MIQTITLLLHIISAVASIGFALYAAQYSYKLHIEKATHAFKTTWGITLLTVVSGIIVSILSQAPIVSTCVSLFSFVGFISLLHIYHLVKVSNTLSR